jgi:periplasmic protein TonB
MSPFYYALHIGTLAIWLGVAGFGTVGMVIRDTWGNSPPVKNPDSYKDLKATVMTEGFSDAPLPPVQETDTSTTPEAAADPTPTPPKMEEIPDLAPIPEIPNLPAAVAKSAAIPTPTPAKSRPSQPSPARPAAATGKPATVGKPATSGQNTGSGLSDAKRLAGGRMPAPTYPAAARSRGQTGTVGVEFVVGADGRVVSAFAKTPCPWPILNDCAVSTVRRWKFPPGAVTKYTRPITFKLK